MLGPAIVSAVTPIEEETAQLADPPLTPVSQLAVDASVLRGLRTRFVFGGSPPPRSLATTLMEWLEQCGWMGKLWESIPSHGTDS